MTAWLIAAVALMPALAVGIIMCGRGSIAQRLAAVQLTGGIVTLVLVIATFAFAQASSIDLALTVALLTLPAALLYAVFVERWL